MKKLIVIISQKCVTHSAKSGSLTDVRKGSISWILH